MSRLGLLQLDSVWTALEVFDLSRPLRARLEVDVRRGRLFQASARAERGRSYAAS